MIVITILHHPPIQMAILDAENMATTTKKHKFTDHPTYTYPTSQQCYKAGDLCAFEDFNFSKVRE